MTYPYITSEFPLILASSSPRRKRLMKQVGLPFRAVASRINEESETGEPAAMALSLAQKKAGAAFGKLRDHWILGADTIVVLGDEVLGKPADRGQAATMLSLLSGREHMVITGFCILNPSGHPAYSEDVASAVRMKKLTREEIEGYIDTGEPFGKAGSYAIQGIGAFMVEGIAGSYTNVVGLPVCEVIKALLGVGALRNYPFSLLQ